MSQGGAAKVQEVSTGAAVIRGGLRKELIPGPLTRQPRTPKDIHARTKLRLRDRDTEERLTYAAMAATDQGMFPGPALIRGSIPMEKMLGHLEP